MAYHTLKSMFLAHD